MQGTQIDRVGRTVIGVLGICTSGGEVLGSAKGSYLVDRLLGGRGAQYGVVRVVARWEGCFHSRDDRDHHGWHPCVRRGVHRGSRRASAALLCSGCGAIGRWTRSYCSCKPPHQWWSSGGIRRPSQTPLELCRQSAGGKIGIVSSSWLVALQDIWALLARHEQNRLDSAGWLLRLRGGR